MSVRAHTTEKGVLYCFHGRDAYQTNYGLYKFDGQECIAFYDNYSGQYRIYDPWKNYEVASTSREFFERNLLKFKVKDFELRSPDTSVQC